MPPWLPSACVRASSGIMIIMAMMMKLDAGCSNIGWTRNNTTQTPVRVSECSPRPWARGLASASHRHSGKPPSPASCLRMPPFVQHLLTRDIDRCSRSRGGFSVNFSFGHCSLGAGGGGGRHWRLQLPSPQRSIFPVGHRHGSLAAVLRLSQYRGPRPTVHHDTQHDTT